MGAFFNFQFRFQSTGGQAVGVTGSSPIPTHANIDNLAGTAVTFGRCRPDPVDDDLIAATMAGTLRGTTAER